MKELSIEEKAKRYDEAIKEAKECHIDGLSLRQPVKDVLEHIFPELKESEDERIKKQIIYAIKELHVCDETKRKCIAWLEKQGEKPAWSEEDEEIHRKCICAMRASACGFPEEEKFVEQVDNWLKSLKERYTWKPSDEQMVAIDTAINVLGKGTLNGKQLIELQEQLKKLREK